MSDHLPAVPDAPELAPVVYRDTDSWTEVMRPVIYLAEQIARTDFVPATMRGNVPATAAAMLYGREIGLPPVTALNSIHVIKGKVGLYAEAMRAQVLAAGHDLYPEETNNAFCKMVGRRRGSDRWTTVTYSMDDAKTAGLLGNDNYRKNPRRMLQARATSEICALLFPDVIRGMSSVEELWDAEATEDQPAGPAAQGTTKVQRRTRRTPQIGDGSADEPPVSPEAGKPPAAGSSPQEPPLPGEPGYDASTSPGVRSVPGTASGGPDDAGVVTPAPSTGAEDAPERTGDRPAPGPEHPPGRARKASSAPPSATPNTTQAPAPTGSAEGASPLAAGQAGKGGASSLGGNDAPPDPPEDLTEPAGRTVAQSGALMAQFKRLNYDDRDERMHAIRALVGRRIESSKQLTRDEASTLIDALAMCRDRAQLDALVDAASK